MPGSPAGRRARASTASNWCLRRRISRRRGFGLGTDDTDRLRVYTLAVYTGSVLDKIEGFDWDGANVGHILRHAVTPFEVEEVVGRTPVIVPANAIHGENRWKLFGRTASGRYPVVVFTVRQKLFRTVTAYEMNAADRRNYAPHID